MTWNIDINTLLQLFSLAAVVGMGWIRLQHLENDVQSLKLEMAALREVRTDTAVIKSKLDILSELIKHFAPKDPAT